MSLEKIRKFVLSTSLYPPVVIFGGIKNPTAQEKKAEQRVINICEDLYRIDNQTLTTLRISLQEINIYELFKKNLKDEYLIKTCATLSAHLYNTNLLFSAMCKKDPILQKYFSGFKLDKTDLDNIWKYVVENLKTIGTKEAAILFKDILKIQSDFIKNG